MIAIIKYGAGNTQSVMNALRRLDAEFMLTDEVDVILSADKVILPGVGHAGHAMETLREKGLDDVIKKVTQPLLGICVGMQLLYESSDEGDTKCLGIIPGRIHRFEGDGLIVPQTGWNTILPNDDPLFDDLGDTPWFYSVHSYYAACNTFTISSSEYGVQYTSAVKKDNFYGTQFHPEKSAGNGQLILKNFISL